VPGEIERAMHDLRPDTDRVRLASAAAIRARGDWRTTSSRVIAVVVVLITAGVWFVSAGLAGTGPTGQLAPAGPAATGEPILGGIVPAPTPPTDPYGIWAIAAEIKPESVIPPSVFLQSDVNTYDKNVWGHAQSLYLSPCGNGITDDSLRPIEVHRIAARTVMKAADITVTNDRPATRLTQFVALFDRGGATNLIAGLRELVKPCKIDGPGGKNFASEILANDFAGDESMLIVQRFGGSVPPTPEAPRHASYQAIVRIGDVVIGLTARWDEPDAPASTAGVAAGLKALSNQFAALVRPEYP
jgi:hypothetical protein